MGDEVIAVGNDEQVFAALCKQRGMSGVRLSYHWTSGSNLIGVDVLAELHLAVPWLPQGAEVQLYSGSYHVLFASYLDAERAFHAVVGDDGPTDTNGYDGRVRVYAALYDSNGEMEIDNT